MITDMTEGNIPKHLISYSIPLILGNLFQLTYNAVDSIIVGRFIGKEALAAVGVSSPVMNIIILGISGICIGASVLMSNFFGAKKEELIKKEMATTAVFGVYFSLVVVLLGMIAAKLLLRAFQRRFLTCPLHTFGLSFWEHRLPFFIMRFLLP